MSVFRCPECGYAESVRNFRPAHCPGCGKPASRSAPPPCDSSGGKILMWLGIAALVIIMLGTLAAGTAVFVAYTLGKRAVQNVAGAVMPPSNAKDALADLQGGNSMRRSLAINYLKTAPVDRALQPQIAAELERIMTTDQFEGWGAADALVRWATPSQVPALVKATQAENSPMRGPAYKALGATRDPRALPVLIAGLSNVHVCRDAADGLINWGSSIETEMIKYVGSNDIFVQQQAQRVMSTVGTSKSIPALQAERDRLAKSIMGLDRNAAVEIDRVIRAIQARGA